MKTMPKKYQTELKFAKKIEAKSDKSYVKWKGYDSSFNSWIHKKDVII